MIPVVRSFSTTMATIGDVRKTSNGCSVAERISREKAGFRVPSSNIAAIDFGTTNCSVAYTIAGDKGLHLLPLNNNFYRVPTAILFARDGSVKTFGYDARTEYLNLDDDERLQYAYFEQIKMNLQHDEVRMYIESIYYSPFLSMKLLLECNKDTQVAVANKQYPITRP